MSIRTGSTRPLSSARIVVTRDIDTPRGVGRVHIAGPSSPKAALLLGHGAGGSVEARDIQASAKLAGEHGMTSVLVEQPYRVAGKKSTPATHILDDAWLAIAASLRAHELGHELPLIFGGRSSGARVACRTAGPAGAAGVLCLAFPLIPPGGPAKTRLPELEAVPVPTLVVQGASDRFGVPPVAPGREVAVIKGDHGLKSDMGALRAAVDEWLSRWPWGTSSP